MTEEAIRIDDTDFIETVERLAEERRSAGLEEPPSDPGAVIAAWKKLQAASKVTSFVSYRLIVVIKPQDGRFQAYCPAIEGCEAEGATVNEARANVVRVLHERLSDLAAHGEPIPSEDQLVETVNILLPSPE